jgi:hypothetical protein
MRDCAHGYPTDLTLEFKLGIGLELMMCSFEHVKNEKRCSTAVGEKIIDLAAKS